MNQGWAEEHHMDLDGYVARVNHHLERLGVVSRPPLQDYVEAWNQQMPAKKMAETYQRRLRKGQTRGGAQA